MEGKLVFFLIVGCNVVVKAKGLIVLPRSIPSFSSVCWPRLTIYIFPQSWERIVRRPQLGGGRAASYFPMILDSNQAWRLPTVRDERRAAQLSSKKETFNCLKLFVICRGRQRDEKARRNDDFLIWLKLNQNKYLHFLSSSVLSVVISKEWQTNTQSCVVWLNKCGGRLISSTVSRCREL